MRFEVGIDPVALHWMLWDHADGRRQVRIDEADLAQKFGVSRGRVSHVILKMRDEGRISRPKGTRGPYTVADPATSPAG